MIKNGVRKQDTLLHQASPATIEPASIKHYSVTQYYLFSYHISPDVNLNEKYIHLFHKILSIMLRVVHELD